TLNTSPSASASPCSPALAAAAMPSRTCCSAGGVEQAATNNTRTSHTRCRYPFRIPCPRCKLAVIMTVCSNVPSMFSSKGVSGMNNGQPWFEHYPEGVPHEINVDEYPSINAVIEEAFQNYRDHPAFANFGQKLTFGDID